MGRLQDITGRLGDISKEEYEAFQEVDRVLTSKDPMVAIPFTYLKTLVQYTDRLFRVYEDIKATYAVVPVPGAENLIDAILTKEEVAQVEEAVLMGITIFAEMGGEVLEMLEREKQEGLQGPLAQKSPFMGGNGQKH